MGSAELQKHRPMRPKITIEYEISSILKPHFMSPACVWTTFRPAKNINSKMWYYVCLCLAKNKYILKVAKVDSFPSMSHRRTFSLFLAKRKVLTFCQPGWLVGWLACTPPCNKSLLTFWLVRGLLPALLDYPSSHKRGLFTFIYIAHCDVNQISKRPCIIDIFLSLQWFVKYLHPFKHETVIDTWYFVCYLCICMIFVKDTLHGICMIFAGACSYWYSPPQWTPLTSLLGRNSLIPPGPSISYPLVLEDPSNAQPVCFPYLKDPLYDAWCRPVVPSYPPVLE